MKVDKVWNDNSFLNLNSQAKLLYLYLVTHPSQSELGVLQLNPKLTSAQLNYSDGEFREASKDLRNAGKLTLIKSNDDIYFIVNDYYTKSAKSHALITRLNSKIEAFPDEVQEYLKGSLNINLEVKKFKLPTIEDVENYAKEKGFNVNGATFIEYYTSMADTLGREGFYDKNGRKVVDWKAKMRKVWFRDDNKLKVLEGTPKGYETFSITINNKTIYPTAWVEGLPRHTNFAITKQLQSEYEKQSKGSGEVSKTESKSNTRRRQQSTSN